MRIGLLTIPFLMSACGALNTARPLDKGEHRVGITGGGAVLPLGPPIPLPNLGHRRTEWLVSSARSPTRCELWHQHHRTRLWYRRTPRRHFTSTDGTKWGCPLNLSDRKTPLLQQLVRQYKRIRDAQSLFLESSRSNSRLEYQPTPRLCWGCKLLRYYRSGVDPCSLCWSTVEQ